MDPFLVLGFLAMVSGWTITLGSIWYVGTRTFRRVQAIEDVAMPLMGKASAALDETRPLMEKVSSALDGIPEFMAKADALLTEETVANLTDLRMVPATIQMGMEKMLKDQLETQGSPLRVYTRAVIEEGVSAFSASLSQQFGALKTLAPAAASLMGQRSVEVRMDKKEGREAVAALLEQFGPMKNLIEKLVPASKREDPAEFLAYLAKMKGMISSFAPGIGQMLDEQVAQFLMSGTGGGLENVGDLVKMFPVKTAAAGGDGAPDYMRA